MRDEKACPTCGGPLVWKGNVLDGALDCEHCAQVEFVEEPTQLAMLKDEEQPTAEEIDANIKSLNRAAGIKAEYAEWDDLCLHDIYMDKASGKDFTPEYKYFQTGGRQTGRTHGMVLRALAAAAEGSPVIILAHDPKGVRYIVDILLRLDVSVVNRHHGHFEVRRRVGVGSTRLSVLSVQVSPRGIPRDRKVFFDHYIFECDGGIVFQEALSEWRSLHEIQS